MQPVDLYTNNAAIKWHDNTLQLLDQRILPHQINYLEYHDASSLAQGIKDMVVRGAPAIGISAAYGVALEASKLGPQGNYQWALDTLAQSRPTAVNLFWALERMDKAIEENRHLEPSAFSQKILQLAQALHFEDVQANQTMGRFGSDHIAATKNGDIRVITHCNAGALATGGFGTALGVIRTLHADNRLEHAYASETRPWLQGARLTAYELMQEKIDTRLITEGAVGQLMAQEQIDWVIVGADRIAANGDVANKIGTYNLAVLAKHHGVNMMVVAPTSTFDMSLSDGTAIPIEHRPQHEITDFREHAIAPMGCQAINPSFDVTPHELIDAIICEHGVITNPCTRSMSHFFQQVKRP